MANLVQESGTYKNLSASANIATGKGTLLGIFVASASATPTILVEDALTDVAPLIVNTFVPAAGTFYPIPAIYGTGLYIKISGTVDCTVFYREWVS